MAVLIAMAGHERIQAFDSMGKTQPRQEVQRAIDGRRLGGLAVSAEGRNEIISLGGLPGGEEQFEHAAPRCRQSLAMLSAAYFRPSQRSDQIGTMKSSWGVIVVAGIAHDLRGRAGPRSVQVGLVGGRIDDRL